MLKELSIKERLALYVCHLCMWLIVNKFPNPWFLVRVMKIVCDWIPDRHA